MSASKKYKLFSAASVTENGVAPICAFFSTDAGCKNGLNCKFKHVLADPPVVASNAVDESSSVISTESEGEVANHSLFVNQGEMTKKENSTKNRKKRTKAELDGNSSNIFASPKKGGSSNSTDQEQYVPDVTPSMSQKKMSSKEKQTTEVTPSKKQKKLPSMNNYVEKGKNPTRDFRSLNLPIASFSLDHGKKTHKTETSQPKYRRADEESSGVASPHADLPLPNNSVVGLKWTKFVLKTRAHRRYDPSFDFSSYKNEELSGGRGAPSEWIKARPYGDWCIKNPQSIAIDCEMCETKDPVSGARNPTALCRVSIVNAANADEVLLDTLVKPAWPVVNHRTWVNGIAAEHLENVQFTLRHAQAFLMALCSEETVIIGHALHNDLAALKMEHHCNVDSSLLFSVKDSPDASPSLRDLAKAILGKDMPTAHDSVNDARTALCCVEAYVEREGQVEPIVRTPRYSKIAASQLFVHRIPRVCKSEHLTNMFLAHTSVKPSQVDEIEFSASSGKTHVTFSSSRHANLAFDSLDGTVELDKSGKLQKKVFLRNGDYVRVRKMLKNKTEP